MLTGRGLLPSSESLCMLEATEGKTDRGRRKLLRLAHDGCLCAERVECLIHRKKVARVCASTQHLCTGDLELRCLAPTSIRPRTIHDSEVCSAV